MLLLHCQPHLLTDACVASCDGIGATCSHGDGQQEEVVATVGKFCPQEFLRQVHHSSTWVYKRGNDDDDDDDDDRTVNLYSPQYPSGKKFHYIQCSSSDFTVESIGLVET